MYNNTRLDYFIYDVSYKRINRMYILIKSNYILQINKIKETRLLQKSAFYNIRIYKYIFLYLIVFYYTITTCNVYINTFYKLLLLLLLVYQLFTIFFFLNKYNYFGKYTSQVQRFWKRSYILLWLIEFFLFILVISLLLLHFKESEYFYDIKLLTNLYYDYSYTFLIQCVLIYTIVISNYIVLILYKYNNYIYANLLLLVINIIIVLILMFETYKYINTIITYKNITNYKTNLNQNLFYISNNLIEHNCKQRVLLSYIYIFFLVKFWHIAYIFSYYVFTIFRLNSSYTKSYDLLSSNLQNFIFLFIFNLCLYTVYLKYILYYTISKTFDIYFMNTYCELQYVKIELLYFINLVFLIMCL